MCLFEYSTPFAVILSVLLRDIQQCKLRHSPFKQHRVAFPLVVAEGDILAVDVPVASLQLSDQRAFRYLPAPQQTVWSDIVGKRGKQERIFPELPEHRAELTQVSAQERVRLPFRHCPCRVSFARLKLMSVAYIRVMLFRVPALIVMSSLS